MDLKPALHSLFGFGDFRPGQREACEAALADRDVLVVMPTGSGKSLCYQLPGLLRDDLTVVVSPLVALMQDQVEALAARGLGDRVALVNAQQDGSANAGVLARAAAGELRLLYVAPERFAAQGFLDRMREVRVGLFVVDEAHCVSQWGHDFRPDYFRLADAARALGARALIASTATATQRVALDVERRLGLSDPLRVATGFDRPNIAFAVARPGGHEKRPLIAEVLREPDSLPAIVYAGTRAGAEELAGELTTALGEEALAYHAGLDREHRATVQRRFLADDARVICATNAFGMGVDKSNVRTVVHASVPASLEAYYQEAGRAGRDGGPARALLLAENRDKALHVHFIKREQIDEGLPGWLADRIAAAADGEGRYALDAQDLVRGLGGDGDRLRALLGHLTRAGVISPSPSAPDRIAGRLVGRFDGRAAALCRSSLEEGIKARWRQYREIWAYVEQDSCRRAAILGHFGDHSTPAARAGACCDACDPGLVPAPPPPDPAAIEDLDDAIISVARSARPAVGRTTCAEIVHGGRSKKLLRNSYDGLPAYGTSSRMRRADILARVDELIGSGRLETTGGPYPVLRLPAHAAAA
ncbi:MAG: ATP-dependent helicase RecQ [Thermoleophilaceae bacterium]|jgi:ATP-dependent DNA helicase RecQ|nr:ATP-dependent helicase RecQ [Thermoleophilaceae bacterium]